MADNELGKLCRLLREMVGVTTGSHGAVHITYDPNPVKGNRWSVHAEHREYRGDTAEAAVKEAIAKVRVSLDRFVWESQRDIAHAKELMEEAKNV